jgi:agmatinase
MNFFSNTLFADAEAEYPDAQYVIFGVPYDGTTSFRAGARNGPRAIRDLSYNFEKYHPATGGDLGRIPFTDLGDIVPFVRAEAVSGQVEEVARGICRDGKIPIMLGGEHSASIGAVSGVRPDCVVICDAHLDLREEFGGDPYNHACTARRIADEIGIENIFIIGGRSGTEEEYAFAERYHLYTADDVRNRGISDIIHEIRPAIFSKRLYLSIDADVIDCCLTPGVGTPEPFGLSPLDIREVIRTLAPQAIGFDYMEVCPVDADQTEAVAARLIREFIAVHWKSRKIS